MSERESILIIDDDEGTCRSLSLIFGRKGYETEAVGTGREAIERAKKTSFNMALLDIRLPDMEGTELIAPLKEIQPDIVVVMVTAYASLETAVRALNEGASAYIIKPLQMDEVLLKVKEALERQHLVMENRRLYAETQRELSERKRAEDALAAERERLEATIASMTDGLVMLDRDCVVATINPALENMLGLRAEELIGMPTAGWCVDPQLSPLVALCHAGSGEEIMLNSPSQRVLKVYTSGVSDSTGSYLGEVRVVHDVTREKELERLKDDFISNVSHELRSPLHSIRGFIRLMLDGKVPDLQTHREFLTLVEDQSKHLNKLVDDLLDVFRMESGQMELEKQPASMREVIDKAVKRLRNLADGKGITIEIKTADVLPDVEGDAERLEHVVANLVDNAIKFSHQGGRIIIEANGRDGKLLTKVTDNGIGIPAEAIPRLFERFYQVDSSMTRGAGGSGLGLYISRQIVEAHGGEIWVESEPGRGSTFNFTIPLAGAAMPQATEIQ